jgi:hypothetical protein
VLEFKTEDKPSGVALYEVRIGGGESVAIPATELIHNPYKMPLQSPGKHTVMVKAVDAAGNFTLAATDVIIEPLEPPIITDLPPRMMVGENLIVKGSSKYPDGTVTVFIQKEGGEIFKGEVKTDVEGNWLLVYPKSLEKGIYQIWAEITDKRGAKSLPTDKITISVAMPAFLRWGRLAIDYLTMIITLLILIGALVLIILYGWYRINEWRRKLRKEEREAEEAIRRAFDALRQEVEEQVAKLDRKPGLSPTEQKIRDDLQEALNISEEFISKEMKDIEKELE